MDVSQNRPPGRDAPDEELIDTLIAISVIAKRLAEKLRKQLDKKPFAAPAVTQGPEGRENGGFYNE